uniref:(northern house mosquito) hypothetical protein n=1 Tax=Culex pipiens TaxID=7175 RepID=A0A8D8DBY5_CULPI
MTMKSQTTPPTQKRNQPLGARNAPPSAKFSARACPSARRSSTRARSRASAFRLRKRAPSNGWRKACAKISRRGRNISNFCDRLNPGPRTFRPFSSICLWTKQC